MIIRSIYATLLLLCVFSCKETQKQSASDSEDLLWEGVEVVPTKLKEEVEGSVSSGVNVAVVERFSWQGKEGFSAFLPAEIDGYYVAPRFGELRDRFDQWEASEFIASWISEKGEESELKQVVDWLRKSPWLERECFVAIELGEPAAWGECFGVLLSYVEGCARSLLGSMGDTLSRQNQGVDRDEELETMTKRFLLQLESLCPIPSIYVGGKLEGEEKRLCIAELGGIESLIGAASVFERAGGSFVEHRLRLGDALDLLTLKDTLDRLLGEESKDLIDVLKEREVSFIYGEIDEYLVFFLGSERSDFVLAGGDENLWDKCLQGKLSEYKPEKVTALGYTSEQLCRVSEVMSFEEIMRVTLAAVLRGAREGLDSSSYFNEEVSCSNLLLAVAEVLDHLGEKFPRVVKDKISVLLEDQGWRLNSYGGLQPDIDLETPRGKLDVGADVFFQAHWMTSESGARRWREAGHLWLDLLEEYALLSIESIIQSEPDAGHFLEDLREKDAIGALRSVLESIIIDLPDSLGRENLLVLDLKGTSPRLPTLDEVWLEAPFPRVGYIRDIRKRKALASAWSKCYEGLQDCAHACETVFGGHVPAQKPLSRRAEDMMSWFFPIPFGHDDCLPSVSIGEQRWMLGSSPEFAEGFLLGNQQLPKEAGRSWVFRMAPLWEFGRLWKDVLDKQREHLSAEGVENEKARESFDDLLVGWEVLQKCFKEVESVSGRIWLDEDGELRSETKLQKPLK